MSKQSDLVSVSQGASGDPLYIDTTNNNVGIGTTSPNNYSGWTTLTIANPTNGGIIDFEDNGAVCLQLASTTSDTTFNHQQNGYMAFRTNNTERLRIDSAGRVTMPYQPAFSAYSTSNSFTTSVGFIFPWESTHINIGGHYNTSNGRFTAPVSGAYQFSWTTLNRDATSQIASLYKNGANVFPQGPLHVSNHAVAEATVGATVLINLSVGDYVDVRVLSLNGGSIFWGQGHANFCGKLVG